MTNAEELILQELSAIRQEMSAIRQQLECLLVPVAEQAGRQAGRMTNEQRKAWNKEQLAKAKKAAGRG